MNKETETKLLGIASEYAVFHKKEKEKQAYHINIIDELHANENAHSRILVKLLQYNTPQKAYPILESFLVLLSGISSEGIPAPVKPKVNFNQNNIDALITDNHFAVIIENKIHWAKDQQNQLERYIETLERKMIKRENIWVVYLTHDGSKKVSEDSFSKKSKNEFENRYIELNYRDHILPWLKEEVAPNCLVKEEWLYTAIHQYSDHLEGILGLRPKDKLLNQSLNKWIINKFNLKQSNIVKKLEELRKQEQEVNSLLQGITNNISLLETEVLKPFYDLTADVFREQFGIEIRKEVYSKTGKFIQFCSNKWHTDVHFEWIPISVENLLNKNQYKLDFHVEGTLIQKYKENGNSQKIKDSVKSLESILDKNLNDSTLFSKNYSTPNGKPFYELSREEQKLFLESVYTDVAPIIHAVNSIFEVK